MMGESLNLMAALISQQLKALTEQTDASSYPILVEVPQKDADRVRDRLDSMGMNYTESKVGRVVIFETDQPKGQITTLANTSGITRIDHNPTFKTHGAAVEDASVGVGFSPTFIEEESERVDLKTATEMYNVEEAWRKAENKGHGVDIGVIDTAVDTSHEAIKHAIVAEKSNPRQGEDHGTWVVSAIAARETETPSGAVVRGMAPEANIHVHGALSGGSATMGDIIGAIGWMIDQDVDAINMSFGGQSSEILRSVIKEADEAGIVLVSSCGNSGPASRTISAPAEYPEVLSVASVETTGKPASFSSRGPTPSGLEAPDVAGFGGCTVDENGNRVITEVIVGAAANDQYKALMGTSMASPQITGLSGLKIGQEKTNEQ